MVRRWLVWGAVYLVLGVRSVSVQATSPEVLIRAVYPNPVGDETEEWVMLENTAEASISGQWELSDGTGAIKTYGWETVAPGFVKIPRTLSKISLNNDQDWVSLSLDGNLVAVSEPYDNLDEGLIWVQLSAGWQAITEADFELRAAAGDWQSDPEITDIEEETSQEESVVPVPTPRPTPAAAAARGDPQPTPGPPEIPYQEWLTAPHLSAFPPPGGTDSAVTSPLPSYPTIDGAAQRRLYVQWQRQALAGSYLLLFAGLCGEVISVPVLLRWYNEKQCIW